MAELGLKVGGGREVIMRDEGMPGEGDRRKRQVKIAIALHEFGKIGMLSGLILLLRG